MLNTHRLFGSICLSSDDFLQKMKIQALLLIFGLVTVINAAPPSFGLAGNYLKNMMLNVFFFGFEVMCNEQQVWLL